MVSDFFGGLLCSNSSGFPSCCSLLAATSCGLGSMGSRSSCSAEDELLTGFDRLWSGFAAELLGKSAVWELITYKGRRSREPSVPSPESLLSGPCHTPILAYVAMTFMLMIYTPRRGFAKLLESGR